MNKETGFVAWQFVPGVVESADGLPIMQTVHPGNFSETKTQQGQGSRTLSSLADHPCDLLRPPELG